MADKKKRRMDCGDVFIVTSSAYSKRQQKGQCTDAQALRLKRRGGFFEFFDADATTYWYCTDRYGT
jgi:hypothetical protein